MKNLEFDEEKLATEIFSGLSSLYIKEMLETTNFSDIDLKEFDDDAENLGLLSFRLAKGFRKARLKAFK
mgnify:CR=1 FL=1